MSTSVANCLLIKYLTGGQVDKLTLKWWQKKSMKLLLQNYILGSNLWIYHYYFLWEKIILFIFSLEGNAKWV